jgi:hypothetical protein
VTAGNGAAAPLGSLGGSPVHVVLGGTGWRALIIAGAVLIAAAGIAVMVRAGQLPVMSARYERPAGRRGAAGPAAGSGTTGTGMTGSGMTGSKTVGSKTTGSMWEALSAGADPTARPE